MNQFQLTNKPTCPCCQRTLDGATTIDSHARSVKPNDVSMCVYCRTFLRFNDDLSLVELTPEEIVNLPADLRAQLIRARETMREAS